MNFYHEQLVAARSAQKERKKKIGKFIEIGELAEKAGIAKLPKEILLGAFLFIAKEKQKEHWKLDGLNALDETDSIIFIAATNPPSLSTLQTLRKYKFFYDKINNRFFGPSKNKRNAEKFL